MKNFDTKKIQDRLESISKEFDGMMAQIGFPSGKKYEDGTNVAEVAAIHEYGAPKAKIDARPFFRPAIKKHHDEWVDVLKDKIPDVLSKKETSFDVLDYVGRIAAANVQKEISEVTSPPLKEETIKRKGFDKPLIDTGYMLASVTNSVAKKGSEFVSKN